MTDTSKEIENKVFEMMQKKTPSQRIVMACSMFTTARKLMLSSIDKNLTEAQKRGEIFRRTYGEDFSIDELTEISKQLNGVELV